ncbi:Phytanoyl-CoA dioxygenase [Candidatus Pelagibacterales bacterium]
MTLKSYIKLFVKQSVFEPPRNRFKIHILNILGIQIIRYIIKNILFYTKKKNFSNNLSLKNNKIFNIELYNQFQSDGIIIINNFLPQDKFDLINKFCLDFEKKNYFEQVNFGKKKVITGSINFNQKDLSNRDIINKIFLETGINQFISKYLNIKVSSIPNIGYQSINLSDDFEDIEDDNSEYHADRFYPCIKVFLTLNDNTISNGCYHYIKKSHRANFKRVKHEYFHSIYQKNKLSKNKIINKDYQIRNGRLTFTEKYINRNYNLKNIIACEAPKNSLVISDNKGFHKRGYFKSSNIRRQLRFSYYDFQIPQVFQKIKKIYLDQKIKS